MSYCVNCGVELDKSAEKCVLCDTVVINPASSPQNDVKPPYPDNLIIPKAVRKRYTAFLISIIILIPNVVSALINIIFPESGNWSIYVMSTSTLVWFLFVFPFLLKKKHPYMLLSIDIAVTTVYTYVFFAMVKQKGWFLNMALPIIIFFFFICLFMLKWLSRKRDPLHIVIAVLAEIALFSIFVDFLVNRFYETGMIIAISIVIAASCLALIGFFIFALTNKRFRAWLSRKFFV